LSASFESDRITEPYNYTGLVGAPIITNQTTTVSSFHSQGFFTGTSYTSLSMATATAEPLLNNVVPAEMVIQFKQPLLKSFGYRAHGPARGPKTACFASR
jgi:hypothetical protein